MGMIGKLMMRILLHVFAKWFHCTVIVEHKPMFYPSLGQIYDETFYTVMRDETYLFQINEDILKNWVTPSHLLSLFKDR